MKAKTIAKTINAKVSDWLLTLPLELAEKVNSKVVVTGGSIASMFLKEPVNDYDMYFKDIKSAILITQYYCNKWIEDNNSGKNGVSKPLQPALRLTFENYQTRDKYLTMFPLGCSGGDNTNTIIVPANCKGIDDFLVMKSDWVNCIRVEIFIQSAGFVGTNPDEEYNYFETSANPEDVGEYIDKTIMNEDSINKQDTGKYEIIFMSSNAITLSDKVQLVIRFFGEPSEIHDTYDFIHATNYWTKKEGLKTNVRALEALLAKELIYSGSKYPLASIFRTRKFIKREWNCHVGNYVKMAMQLNEMDLSDPVVLEEQLTGVDAAYLFQIIQAVKNKRKDDPTFEFNSSYICELVDRMMGLSGEELSDNDESIEDLI